MKKRKSKKIKRIKKVNFIKPISIDKFPFNSTFNEKYDNCDLKKWCVEQASLITKGNFDTTNILKEAQKIFDWVTK